MPDARMTRRLAAMLATRLDEARFDEVQDGRELRGRRWQIRTLLIAVVTAMAAGAKSLAEAERVTATLPRAARRWLGIARRVPDITLRDALGRLRPPDLISSLHAIVLAAYRRKAVQPLQGLPFGFVSLDGKAFSIPETDIQAPSPSAIRPRVQARRRSRSTGYRSRSPDSTDQR